MIFYFEATTEYFPFYSIHFLGYDIRTETAYMQTMNEFERIVGFEYLKAVHLNDSNGIYMLIDNYIYIFEVI
jgi:hypothetical protein